ncbi:hypothetical protein ACIQOW_09770 [Kitasatospora sp. NPDC091335]|uniref:hypothetical protein n=1 Tax=Kitasatospora sp. NPDC091335 TaxID=3364085 RepID=UPI00380568B0
MDPLPPGEMGRRAEGLAASEEAVRHYRMLADANPKAFDPHLQRSLTVVAWLEGLEP